MTEDERKERLALGTEIESVRKKVVGLLENIEELEPTCLKLGNVDDLCSIQESMGDLLLVLVDMLIEVSPDEVEKRKLRPVRYNGELLDD